MTTRSETLLFRAAAAWTAIGLAGGLAYREITKAAEFTGFTQLSVVHTHALALGSLVGLAVLALTKLYSLGEQRSFTWFFWLWNAGLGVTVGCLATKGILQVAGSAAATSPAISGISGLGHMVLSAGLVMLFVALGARLKRGRVSAG